MAKRLTPRAYTLRLRGIDPTDTSWRDALWATHEAINNGAKAFGDWLLTLRGGLDHTLAEPPPLPKGKKRTDDETAAMRKNRRILLALSWLSVEDARGAKHLELCIVACGSTCKRPADGKYDTGQERKDKVLAALRSILSDPARRVAPSEIESWLADCTSSLSGNIRDDAVWVNRSAAFDAAKARIGPTLTREETWDILEPFFASREAFLTPLDVDEEATEAGEEKAKALGQKAGQWLSSRFGTGTGADFASMAKVYTAMSTWAEEAVAFRSGADALKALTSVLGTFKPKSDDADGILALISGPGYKSATRNIVKSWGERVGAVSRDDLNEFGETAASDIEKCKGKDGGKGRRTWSDKVLDDVEKACGFTYLQADGPARHAEFAVMLDHAARRVSIGHSWIKRAESERRRFEEDAKKLADVPTVASARLDRLVSDRSGTSGATVAGGEYRIRRRAIEAWDEVLRRWKRAVCKTVVDRIAAAREVQADPEIEKFGDSQLFEALAADDAECVWRIDGKADAAPLRDYVLGHDARNKQQRFKVPAYRHPDPLRHPVFGDFGNSRWEVQYAVLESAKAARGDRRVSAKDAAWIKNQRSMRMRLWDGNSLNDIDLRWSSKRLTADLALGQDTAVEGRGSNAPVREVTRADRLGSAASGLKSGEVPSATGLFALSDWNACLQAPRQQLNDLAKHVDKHGWDAKAKEMRSRIRWLASFSAKLQCRGPFIEYAKTFADTDPAKPFVSRKGELAIKHATNKNRQGNAKLILSRLPGVRTLSVDLGHRFAAGCAVWETLSLADFKKEVAGRAIVDGGSDQRHLYLHTRHTDPHSKKERTTVYRRVGPDALADGSGHPAPWARLDRQFLIKLQGEEKPARAATNKPEHGINEVAMVADFSKDFDLIRDNGGEQAGRGVDELMYRAMRLLTLGLKRHGRRAKIAYALKPDCPGIPGMGGACKLITRGDDEHVRFLNGALADWHALATDTDWDGSHARELWNSYIKPLSHGFQIDLPVPPDMNAEGPTRQQRRKENDTLRDEKIKPIAEYLAKSPSVTTGAMHNAWAKRWRDDDGIERTKDDFENILAKDAKGRISSTTKPRKGKEATAGWHTRLRLLTDWLMGWHLPGEQSNRWNRNVGGLSLTRIATMRSLYQLHKAFAMRPTPDKVQGAPKFGESNTGIAQRTLDAMETMREQRVKQLASRIAAGALGLGGHWKEVQRRDHKGRPLVDTKGQPRMKSAWIEEPSPKYEPCHAVVIESLRNYRPDELQTRRENKALIDWSSGKVRKYLEEACQLHGLHLREVQPNYTSRQCSRTGLPGVRCADVPVDPNTGEVMVYWWKKALASAKKKGDEGKKDTESLFLIALAEHLADLKSKGKPLPRTVRVPRKGGDLFIAAPADKPHSSENRAIPTPRALQADLNAAANIGLRALLDPDFPGRWWYVPASIDTGRRVPAPKSCAGAACLTGWSVAPDDGYYTHQGQALTAANEDDVIRAKTALDEAKKTWDTAKKTLKKSGRDESTLTQHPLKLAHDAAKDAHAEAKKSATQKEIINLWQDPQADRPTSSPSAGRWRESGGYWAWVRARAVKALWEFNGLPSAFVPKVES